MPFSPFPKLKSKRLTLRQLVVEDKELIFALRSHPEVNKYLDRPVCHDMEEALAFIQKVNANILNQVALYWAIIISDTHTFAGTICLFDFSAEESSCEIGFELLPQYQGQGIMKEAIESVLHFVSTDLRLRNIKAFVHPDNLPSASLLKALHFDLLHQKDERYGGLNYFMVAL